MPAESGPAAFARHRPGQTGGMESATTPEVLPTERFLSGAEVAERVRRFDDELVNWYLVEDGDALALVDAGLPRDWSMLTAALGALGRRLSEVRAVVLTHGHVDHLGFAKRLQREAGVDVLVHEDDARLARSPRIIAESERSPFRRRRDRHPRPYTGRTGPRIVAAAATKDTAQALASLDRLREVEADVLLPGHGEPWRGGLADAVRRARAAGRS